MWHLIGYDTFEGEYYPLAKFNNEEACRLAADDKLTELEQTQPSASSGGQGFGGIQDHVYIQHPDGRRERVFPTR